MKTLNLSTASILLTALFISCKKYVASPVNGKVTIYDNWSLSSDSTIFQTWAPLKDTVIIKKYIGVSGDFFNFSVTWHPLYE